MSAAESLTDADIAAIARSKVPQEVIIHRIAECEPHFLLTPAALESLAQVGVSEDVIRAMAARQNGQPVGGISRPTGATQAAQSRPAPEPRRQREFDRAEVFAGYSYLKIDTNGLSSRQNSSGWEAGVTGAFNKVASSGI